MRHIFITQETRKIVSERDSNRCCLCNRKGSEWRLELHHRTYDDDLPDSLTTLCVSCHNVVTSHQRGLRYDSKDDISLIPVESKMPKILDLTYKAKDPILSVPVNSDMPKILKQKYG